MGGLVGGLILSTNNRRQPPALFATNAQSGFVNPSGSFNGEHAPQPTHAHQHPSPQHTHHLRTQGIKASLQRTKSRDSYNDQQHDDKSIKMVSTLKNELQNVQKKVKQLNAKFEKLEMAISLYEIKMMEIKKEMLQGTNAVEVLV